METTPPHHSKSREVAQAIVEAGLNAIPIAGGTVAVILMTALNHNLNVRRDRWITELAEVVGDLQRRFDGFDPANLADNDIFVDAVMTATRMIERTSQEEKIHALRNAVLNAVAPNAPDQDLQQLYFRLVDELTPTHLRLLAVLDHPERYFEETGLEKPSFGMTSSRRALVDAAIPALAAEGQDITDRFYADLTSGGLVNSGGLNSVMTAAGAWQPVSTNYAKGFLAFISDLTE